MSLTHLGGMLFHDGLIDDEDLRTIKESCGSAPAAFAKAILTVGLMDEDELAHFLSIHTHHHIGPKDLLAERDPELGQILPDYLMASLEVLPMSRQGQFLTVAMLDPTDKGTIHQVEFFTGHRVKPMIATQSHLYAALRKTLSGFEPQTSPLEDFLRHHIEGTLRHLKVSLTPPGRANRVGASASPVAPAARRAPAPPVHAEPAESLDDAADLTLEAPAGDISLDEPLADAAPMVDLAADLGGDIASADFDAPAVEAPTADAPVSIDPDLDGDSSNAIPDVSLEATAEEPAAEVAAEVAVEADPIDNILGGLDNAFAEEPAAESSEPTLEPSVEATEMPTETDAAADITMDDAPIEESTPEPVSAAESESIDDLLSTPADDAPIAATDVTAEGDDMSIDIDVSAETAGASDADLMGDLTVSESPSVEEGDLFGEVLPSEEVAAPAPTAEAPAAEMLSDETLAQDPVASLDESEGTLDDEEVWLADTVSGLNRLQVALSLAPNRDKALADTAKALSRAGLVAGVVFAQSTKGYDAWGDWSSSDDGIVTGNAVGTSVPGASLSALLAKVPENKWADASAIADAGLKKSLSSWLTPDATFRVVRTGGTRPMVCLALWDARAMTHDVLGEMTTDVIRRVSP